MTEALSNVLQMTAAAASVILMGVCGVCLCARLTRVMRGQENASGLTKEPFQIPLPFREMALAAAAAVLSRLALYALAYGFYRAGGGTQSFAGSFEALWTHWDVRHYLGIAKDGYTSVGDERLRLVFFPLYPAVTRVFSVFTGGRLFMAGTLVSLLASGVCAALLYDLANMHLGRRGARLAAAYFLLNPMSVFLACAYTEALFIALTLAAICLLRRGHPWGAALCGMASALTRMPGVIVSGLFIIAFLARILKEGIRVKAALRCLAQVGLVFLRSVHLLVHQLGGDGRRDDVHDLSKGELVSGGRIVLGFDGEYRSLPDFHVRRRRLAVHVGLSTAGDGVYLRPAGGKAEKTAV